MTRGLTYQFTRSTYPLVLTLVLAATVEAQQGPDLAVIRKTTPSSIDSQSVARWVDERLTALFNSATPQTEGPAFMTQMLEHHRATDATPAFREVLAKALTDSFTRQYTPPVAAAGPGGAPAAPVYPAVYPLLVLRRFGDPVALSAYRAVLADPAPGVRLAGLDGLIATRGRLTAQQWPQVLQDIQRVGSTEPDPIVFHRVVRLLSVTETQQVQLVLPVMLRIMDARLTLIEQKRQFPALADADAATWLGARIAGTTNAQVRADIVRQIARILADSVWAYTNQSPSDTQKEHLERVIKTTEEQLKAATAGRQQPDVTAAMLAGGTGQGARMTAELDKWIGTNGLLTQPPFSLQAGLNIQRPATAPATATAPG